MKKQTTKNILSKAYGYLRKGWCQNAEAKDRQGNPVHPSSTLAKSFSVTGAIYRASKFDGSPESRKKYELAVKTVLLKTKEPWLKWHDSPDRTLEDIVRLFWL
jgi:hypothetical protein